MTRVGASQVFFNVVAGFNARKLIQDVDTAMNVMKAVTLDSFEAMLKPLEDMSLSLKIWAGEITDIAQSIGKAQVEFEKFYGGAGDAKALGEEIENIAEQYGVLGDEARIAGARAAQVGAIIGEENIPLLVEQAEILHQISDLTSEEAMKSIISLNQQTGMLYGELNQQQYQRLSQTGKEMVLTAGLTKSLDTLNTIANRSVAVEGQLVEVMTNFASQGALVGESFEDMAAMSAVLLESGEQAGAAGRALRMVYARLGGDIGGARTELESLGFTLTDENGNLKTMMEIMQDLADKGWANFSQATKQHIAQTVAGNRHYVRFIKLMENQARAVELSADALNDVDSAADQARKAMEDYAYQLDIARAEGENLKGAMGEALLPMMVAQQKTANNFAQAKLDLIEMLGPLGKFVGRFNATMQAFGGFIKMSLGMQSLAIGVGMFQSVQEDLHGILIANETLHSKQATYFDMNVTATKEEQNILAHIQFQHQVINKHLERKNHLMAIINNLEMKAAPLRYQEQAQTKHMLDSRIEQMEYEEKATNMANMRVALADKRLLKLDRIRNIQAASVAMSEHEMSLEDRWRQVYKEKTTAQEYYTRQLIIDSDTMQNLRKSDVRQIEHANDRLHQQSMIYQRLISENERVRTAQAAGIGVSGLIQNEQMLAEVPKAIPLFEEFAAKQEKIANKYKVRLDAGEALNEKESEHYDLTKDRIAGSENALRALNDLNAGKTKHLHLDQKGIMVVRDLNKETLAQNIQFDNTLLKLRSLADIEEKQRVYQQASLLARKETTQSYKDLKETLKELGPIEQELADLIKQVEIAMESGADATKQQTELIDHLTGKSKLAADEIERMGNAMEKDYKRASDKAAQASKRFGFAMTSVMGMVLPLISETKAAAMGASILFTTQLIPAIAGVTKAYQAMVDSQLQLMGAENIAQVGRGKMLGQLVKSNAKFLALGVVIAGVSYAYAKLDEQQKAAAKSMKDATEATDKAINSLMTLGDDASIFTAHSDYLEHVYDLEGVTIQDLYNDKEKLIEVNKLLTESVDEYTGSQRDSIETTLEMLRIIQDIQDGTNSFAKEVKKARKELDDTYEGGFLWGGNEWANWTDEVTTWSNERQDAAFALKDALDLSDSAIEEGAWWDIDDISYNIETTLDEIIKAMENGRKLTKEELKLLGKVVDDSDILEIMTELNDTVVDASLASEIEWTLLGKPGAEQAEENINLVGNAIENLTEDIYKFGGAREELFFGGKYGNVTGSLYKQVVTQGVGTLYNKMDIVMSNNFHGFFNEEAAANKIINVLERYAANGGVVAIGE